MLFLIPLFYGAVVSASVLAGRAACNSDNCLRAVIASAFTTRHASADCSSYFLTTVTPATVTVTATATSVISVDGAVNGRDIAVRQATVVPTAIPAYASPCSGSVRYSSACSCLGITAATTTAPTPTTTVTTTTSTTVTAVPTLLAVQFYNDVTCEEGQNDQTLTSAPLGQCVITDESRSANFETFEGGACTPAECYLNFYGAFDCSGGVIGSAPVNSTQCYDFNPVYAVILECPTCP